MSYLALRYVHVGCVAVSIMLFLVRGVLRSFGVPASGNRLLRAAPHVVDSLLLASAVGLAAITHQFPLRDPWLTAKVAGLLLYVALGSLALRPGRPARIRVPAFLAALLTAAWIVSVALTRNPKGFFA